MLRTVAACAGGLSLVLFGAGLFTQEPVLLGWGALLLLAAVILIAKIRGRQQKRIKAAWIAAQLLETPQRQRRTGGFADLRSRGLAALMLGVLALVSRGYCLLNPRSLVEATGFDIAVFLVSLFFPIAALVVGTNAIFEQDGTWFGVAGVIMSVVSLLPILITLFLLL